MAALIYLAILLPFIAWSSLTVKTTRSGEEGTSATRWRPVWTRVPAGYTGVVRRRRSVWVRPAGARIGQPFSSLSLVSTGPRRQTFGPARIAMPDGADLIATGAARFHVVDPAAFVVSPWGRWAPALSRVVAVAVREAAQEVGVDPRVQPSLIGDDARRRIAPYVERDGVVIDSIDVTVATATPAELAAIERVFTRAAHRGRWKQRYYNGVLAALALFFIGLGTWAIVDDVLLRPTEYAHLTSVGVPGQVTVTVCTRSTCEGDYTYDGAGYHGTIPDTSGRPPGTTMPILIDPSNPSTFFPTEYVRAGRNAGLSPVLFFGIAMLALGIWFPVSMLRFERKLNRTFDGRTESR